MSSGLHGHGIKETLHRRGHATVTVAVGGHQPRGEAVWSRRTRRSGVCGTKGTNAARDGKLARYH